MKKEEAYKMILQSKELSDRFESLKDEERLQSFLSEIGYTGDAIEFLQYAKGVFEGEIDDEIVVLRGGEIVKRGSRDEVLPTLIGTPEAAPECGRSLFAKGEDAVC